MTSATSAPDRLSQREEQIRQAEELLASVPQRLGIGKGLFQGKLVSDWIFPYPTLTLAQQADVDAAVERLTSFCDAHLDPAQIDRDADIPRSVIDGLGELGLLGMTAPKELGGQSFTQIQYGRCLEVIGGRCSATGIFVNAHHSIGMRALLMFGTREQQDRWLPGLISGKTIAAFALTEPEAGSDAANVQTTATPSEDGSHFVLNGQKRYITNGAIADVLTVMARTPVPGSDKTAVSAFLVTPDLPGFRVIEPRMEKLGIRGTATAKLAFENMPVPRENLLGTMGKGLKIALTTLDFGRTTFGSCCTGAAKTCLRLAREHVTTRRQFGRTLAEFELTQKKLAQMAAWTYSMEAMTTVTAGLIDRGLEDYMLETAMLKVYVTERLWTIVNDAFQLYGGAAYFTDKPLERMLRDYRINQIGEGANEVLLSFIALTGMRGPALRLKDIYDSLRSPLSGIGKAASWVGDWFSQMFLTPPVPVRSSSLKYAAKGLESEVARLGRIVQRQIIRHREEIVERQLIQERLSWGAMELFAAACSLSRWDEALSRGDHSQDAVARLAFVSSLRQAIAFLRSASSSEWRNGDRLLLDAAQRALMDPPAGST